MMEMTELPAQFQSKDFFGELDHDLNQQSNWLMQELSNRLEGAHYNREKDLPTLLPNVHIKECPLTDVKPVHVSYTLYVIGELKGKLQACVAHKQMMKFFPKFGSYEKELHIALTGALRGETRNLHAQMRDVETHTELAVQLGVKQTNGSKSNKAIPTA